MFWKKKSKPNEDADRLRATYRAPSPPQKAIEVLMLDVMRM